MSLAEPVEIESAGEFAPLPGQEPAVRVVSVVIRVRNAAADLRRCLGHLRPQTLPRDRTMQVVVVDNESSDSSVEVARQFGATVVPLATNQFSWGRALNLGIRAADGDILLLLSADAYPADSQWLMEMLKPLEDPDVCAVYGRQIPRSDAPLDERVRLARMFGPEPIRVPSEPIQGVEPESIELAPSNACAAIRRCVWEAVPYDETITAAEEHPWTRKAMRLGYSCVYTPAAKVFHSHRDPILRHALRSVEFIVQAKANLGLRIGCSDVARCALSMARRRIINVVDSQVPARFKLAGIMRLPFETAAILAVGAAAMNRRAWSRLRSLGWK